MSGGIDISIVTAGRNESGNAEAFVRSVALAIERIGVTSELVYVDDGSTDGTSAAIERSARAQGFHSLRLLRHPEPRGLSAAVATGIAAAEGNLVCLVPADLESLPQDDVPLLYQTLEKDTDVVCGRRLRREDGKQFSSTLFALLNRWFFGVHVHDSNWIKLMRREKLSGLRFYPGWHRFIVALLVGQGCRVKEVETPWNRRQFGRTKFGRRRIPEGIAGAIAVKAFLNYRGRPMLFFSQAAVCSVFVGCALIAVAAWRGPAGWTWIPGWTLGAAALSCAAMCMLVGLALEFIRWDRDEPSLQVRSLASVPPP